MKSKPDLYIQFVAGISSTVFSSLCSFVLYQFVVVCENVAIDCYSKQTKDLIG